MNIKRKVGRPVKGEYKAVGMNISLSVETRERLEQKAEETGQSMAEIIRQALEKYF